MIFKKKLLPLRRQMTYLLSVFLICVICITAWCANSYIDIQKESLYNYLELYAGHMASTTRQAYTTYENIAYSVAYNTVVQDYIQQSNAQKRYESYQQVYNLLNNTAKLNSNIVDIAVVSQDGNSISLIGSPSLYDCFRDAMDSPTHAFLSMGTLEIRKSHCHILAMPIHKLTTSGQNKYLGTAFIAINTQHFFGTDLSSDHSQTPEILFLDDQDRVIYGEEALVTEAMSLQEGTSEEIVIQKTSYLARMYNIFGTGNRLCILFDSSQYTKASLEVSVRLIFGILLAMGLILLSFLMILYPLFTSLQQLTRVMQNITAGEQKTIRSGIDLTDIRFGCTEIRDIYKAFNDMLQEINNLNHTIFRTYTQMYDLEMNNRLTEIAFLRSQINPHFLYNTLTAICGMSAAGMNDKIIEVTNSLSRIFRYSIQGSDMVALKEELDIIRAYLMIQSCRFDDRFSVQYDIKEETLDCQIPKMIIQPLVENAIVHGLEPSLKHGKLIISASLTPSHDHLIISVMDTGVGMPKEKLMTLRSTLRASVRSKSKNAQEHLKSMDASNHDSIGIFNVNSRIVLYYGEDYNIELDSWEGAGTIIRIRIPCSPVMIFAPSVSLKDNSRGNENDQNLSE